MTVKLYGGNLPFDTIEGDLSTLFAQAGSVISVALIKDRTTGMPKGFAFVEMDSQENAQKAITMFNEHNLNDRQIAVSFARPREKRGGFHYGNQAHKRNRDQKRGGSKRRY